LFYTQKDARSATLQWLAPASLGNPALNNYVVEYSTDANTWQALPNGVVATPTISLSNLLPDKDYWFRVRGDNGATAGLDTKLMNLNWAKIKVHTPAQTTPDVVQNLKLSVVSESGATIGWAAPASDGGSSITDFKSEISHDSGKTWTLVAKGGPSTARSVILSGLAPGTDYQIRVSAINAVGASTPAVFAFRTNATAPSAINSLAANKIKGTTLSLTWSLPTTNGGSAITDYAVQVSSNGTSYTNIDHSPSNLLAFAVTNLNAGTKYWFRVAAVNAIGTSAYSAPITAVTVGNTPAAPTSLSVKERRPGVR